MSKRILQDAHTAREVTEVESNSYFQTYSQRLRLPIEDYHLDAYVGDFVVGNGKKVAIEDDNIGKVTGRDAALHSVAPTAFAEPRV